ncbi:hypothetical protein BDF20DRAFT_891458 [Mycotypha africana]|uniref:uncharacterized protein n=1 Tax=Mycotypha africana TaxID=64632 RepID=UPI0023017CA7|nr:uncharacterized protein BDF20DRAFT_891458 [Mycotypha africana]KAI8970464.1 hypothetical protein BDF20DRAFT_891458 [Mycotypha africana]
MASEAARMTSQSLALSHQEYKKWNRCNQGIMCKYPNASRNTMEKEHVYSIHIIRNP